MKLDRRTMLAATAASAAAAIAPTAAVAQRGRGGQGRGGRGRGGRGPQGNGGQDAAHAADQAMIQMLLAGRGAIERKVKMLPGGVETLTETDDPRLRETLLRHVASMKARVEAGAPIHMRDPLFAELFRHAGKIKMVYEPTPRGVHVMEVSDDPYVVKVIQAHAEVVTAFLKNGHAEVRRNHQPPAR